MAHESVAVLCQARHSTARPCCAERDRAAAQHRRTARSRLFASGHLFLPLMQIITIYISQIIIKLDIHRTKSGNHLASIVSCCKTKTLFNMKLTATLFKFHPIFIGKIPKFPGSALKGKNKFVPPAHRGNRYFLWLSWRDEEEVMKYISKPYVTADEELDYLESIGERHQDVDPIYTSKLEPPMRQRYAIEILERFDRNRMHEVWE